MSASQNAVVFEPPSAFGSTQATYDLLPFRHARIPNLPGQVLITSMVGEYAFLADREFSDLIAHRLSRESDLYRYLRTRQFVCDSERGPFFQGIAAQRHTQKLLTEQDPALHIFVVTLRCDHRCHYCQVTPRQTNEAGFDMSADIARAAVDRVFESAAPTLTIEFQGGESALAFERVRQVVGLAEERALETGQSVRFVLTSTLHLLTDDMLGFCHDHGFELSTSLDGPDFVHNANRIIASRDSHERTISGIERARSICGEDRVAALATITHHSLPYAQEIVDAYVELGFPSISLRPISPFGFAAKSSAKLGYSVSEYMSFYRDALDYLIQLNATGVVLDESYATLLLQKILTPFPSSYVDLQSPSAAGRGVLVYNYDGGVYVSDEGRMLAEMGDRRFRMGSVFEPMDSLRVSEAMRIIEEAGNAEELDGCSDCAFVPYCGADPVFHVATQNDPFGHRPTSEFCQRHTGLFELIFEHLAQQDPTTMRVFLSWLSRRSALAISHPGYVA
ncbi:MAG: His-Xaa-Ser system radical SAM maturase HxsB [Limisphaerales bacterium]